MPVQRKTVLLDTNLLLLLVVGRANTQWIRSFKRTHNFTVKDYEALAGIVQKADAVLTTPHILTETSNLANSLRDDQKAAFSHCFAAIISLLQERHTSASHLAADPRFRFGIADVSMLYTEASLILTEDGRFASLVNGIGSSVALDLRSALAYQENLS